MKRVWLCYGILLAGFTSYVLLDTFLLPSGQKAAGEANTAMFAAVPTESIETAETTVTEAATETETETASRRHGGHSSRKSAQEQTTPEPDTQTETSAAAGTTSGNVRTYEDENARITLTEYYENGTRLYVADVQLTSAQYLQTAFAGDTFGRNVTAPTSEIAAAHHAVLAVNGDFYGARESGYVIRNGVVYRDTGNADTDVLCIYADGHFGITNSGETTAQALVEAGVWQAFSFGPALVENAAVTVGERTEVGQAMASNPRTAIGIIDNLHYVLVVSDGRTAESAGLTLYELAQFLQGLGCTTAYNLDGGGSSTMYFEGEVVNNPTTSGRSVKERSVSDIVYIGS